MVTDGQISARVTELSSLLALGQRIAGQAMDAMRARILVGDGGSIRWMLDADEGREAVARYNEGLTLMGEYGQEFAIFLDELGPERVEQYIREGGAT